MGLTARMRMITKEADYMNEADCTNEDDYKAVLYDGYTRRHIVSQCENC